MTEEVVQNGDRLLTPREVAQLWNVDPKTITRWAKEGKLPHLRTLGGHRRYREGLMKAIMEANTADAG